MELYRNDKLMGRERAANYTNNTIVWNIPYTPGTLLAKSFFGPIGGIKYFIINKLRTITVI